MNEDCFCRVCEIKKDCPLHDVQAEIEAKDEIIHKLQEDLLRSNDELSSKLAKAQEEIETLTSERKAVCRLLCGNDTFNGDLLQYIKNEIDGRNAAEERARKAEESVKQWVRTAGENQKSANLCADENVALREKVGVMREALTEIASGNRTVHESINWARQALKEAEWKKIISK